MAIRREFSEEQVCEILQADKTATKKRECKRLVILKLRAVDKKTSTEISQLVGYIPSSIDRIISRYFKNGINDILGEQRKGGNKRYLKKDEETQFLEQFSSSAEKGQMLIISDIKVAYEKSVEKEVSNSMIYRMLSRHKWRKVMPRSQHPKKADAQAIEAYKKNQRESSSC